MLGLILTLALVPQAGSQARLHPADALALVEVPDVPKMVAAYEKAPLIQMLRDPEVQKGFYGAFEGSDIDFDELVSESLTKLGMPVAFADAPLAGIRHYLDGVQAASFSFSLDRAGLESFGPHAIRLKEMRDELQRIDDALEAFREESEEPAPPLPATLAELELEPGDVLDPWDRPYVYEPKPDETYVLRTLGSDGKEGGTGDAADLDLEKIEAEGGKAAESLVGLLGFQGIVEFRDPATLEELRTLIAGLLSKSGAVAKRSGPFQMAGIQAELQSWTPPDEEAKNFEFWLMRAQNSLVFGGGTSSPEAYAARLADPRVKTAAEQFYAGLLREFGAPTGATIVQGTLRLGDYLDTFRKLATIAGEEDSLSSIEGMLPNASLRIQLQGERFVSEIASRYPKPHKLVTDALGLGPLPQSILEMLPEDAIGAYAISIDGPLLWSAIRHEISQDETATAEMEKHVAEMEAKHHFSLEKDIFGSLGKGALVYLLPLKGLPSFLSSITMIVDLQDPAAMQRGIEGLMAMLEASSDGAVKVRSKPYKGMPVWLFDFSAEGDEVEMLGFSPAIAIVKNRLIVALNQRHATKEVKRALGEETGLHLIATEGHKPPADATSYGYMDWAHLLNGVYEGGRSLSGMFGGSDLPVDVARLPEPGVFTRFFQPTIYLTRTIPGGTYTRNESSFGPETWIGLVGVVGLTAAVYTTAESDADSTADEEMEEAAEDGTEAEPSESSRTRDTLRHVATSLAVYQMETGKYPASLDALLTPTKNYPRGFLGKDALPTDAWGRAFRYSMLEGGARFQLWSTGADGTDQQGGGDDLVSP